MSVVQDPAQGQELATFLEKEVIETVEWHTQLSGLRLSSGLSRILKSLPYHILGMIDLLLSVLQGA